MKTGDAVKLAGIAFAGVAAYLVVTRTMKAGGDVVAGAKKVLTEDLNPASTENIVYKATSKAVDAISSDGTSKPLGVRIWEYVNPDKVKAEQDMIGGTSQVSNVKEQKKLISGYSQGGPSVGVYAQPVEDQSDAESARLRRGAALLSSGTYAKNLFDMNYYGNPYGF